MLLNTYTQNQKGVTTLTSFSLTGWLKCFVPIQTNLKILAWRSKSHRNTEQQPIYHI